MLIKKKNDVKKFVEEVWGNLIDIHSISLLKSFTKPKGYLLLTQRGIVNICKKGFLLEYLKDFTPLFELDGFCNPIEKKENVIDEIWEEVEKQLESDYDNSDFHRYCENKRQEEKLSQDRDRYLNDF